MNGLMNRSSEFICGEDHVRKIPVCAKSPYKTLISYVKKVADFNHAHSSPKLPEGLPGDLSFLRDARTGPNPQAFDQPVPTATTLTLEKLTSGSALLLRQVSMDARGLSWLWLVQSQKQGQ